MTTKLEMTVVLQKIAQDFNADETEVLLEVAKRLRIGRAEYGPLNIDCDDRNMLVETAEEGLDQCAYMAMRVIAMKRLSHESGCNTPNELRRLIRDLRGEVAALQRQQGMPRASCG